MTSEIAFFDAANKYLHDGSIDLDSDTLKVALLTSGYDPIPGTVDVWMAYAPRVVGEFIKVYGRFYECVQPGFSGFAPPSFGTARGGTTSDGTSVWKCWGYCPPSPHAVLADVSTHELPSGSGYTTGGEIVTGKAVTYSGRSGKFVCGPVVWGGASFTAARFSVMYRVGSVNGITDPLLFYILMDSTPSDIQLLSPTAFTLTWADAGTLIFN